MISITFIVATFNAFLAVVMLIYNWRLNKNILFFSLYLLIISFISVLYDMIINGGSARLLMLLIGNAGPLLFLAGPLFYFFIRGLVDEHHEFSDKDLIHLMPFFLNIIMMMPYFFKPIEVKLELAENSLQNLTYYMNTKLVFFPTWSGTLIRIASMIFYILWSIVILRRAYRKKISGLKGAVKKQYILNYRWLNVFVFASLFLVVLHVGLTMYFRFDAETDFLCRVKDDNLFLISVIFNSIFPLIILFNPGILFGFPAYKAFNPFIKSHLIDINQEKINEVSDVVEKGKSYNEYFEDLSKKLMANIEQSKLYLRHDFKAENLSKELEVPPHHIHFCIKHYYGKNCNQMINEFRIRYAVELIKSSDKKDEDTIRSVVYDSGFSTRKAFLRAFKQNEGKVFSQWLKENT
ncbi:MAG: AraC family transcriptional regulator [Paludibacter sp.]|nr:AraC family transcriptional regulator [Paludibacter sp.]MDD4198639.1 AraC family transcriptional regulator [Paludibacter sp.]MDD4428371.1 AraC family transcriptional regulator [Paludibacter sp.]